MRYQVDRLMNSNSVSLGTALRFGSDDNDLSQSTGGFCKTDDSGGLDPVIIGDQNVFHKNTFDGSGRQDGQRMAEGNVYKPMCFQILQNQFGDILLDIPDHRTGTIEIKISCPGGPVIAHTEGEDLGVLNRKPIAGD